MAVFIKYLILALFLAVVFGRGYFPSGVLYWATFPFMFALVVLLWFVMFWVSSKRNEAVLGKKPDSDFFVGKVSANVNDDLLRGRLSFIEGKAVLVTRGKKGFERSWELKISDVQSVSFGKTAGLRKGFVLNTASGESIPFVCRKIYNDRTLLYRALGWDIHDEKKTS